MPIPKLPFVPDENTALFFCKRGEEAITIYAKYLGTISAGFKCHVVNGGWELEFDSAGIAIHGDDQYDLVYVATPEEVAKWPHNPDQFAIHFTDAILAAQDIWFKCQNHTSLTQT